MVQSILTNQICEESGEEGHYVWVRTKDGKLMLNRLNSLISRGEVAEVPNELLDELADDIDRMMRKSGMGEYLFVNRRWKVLPNDWANGKIDDLKDLLRCRKSLRTQIRKQARLERELAQARAQVDELKSRNIGLKTAIITHDMAMQDLAEQNQALVIDLECAKIQVEANQRTIGVLQLQMAGKSLDRMRGRQ